MLYSEFVAVVGKFCLFVEGRDQEGTNIVGTNELWFFVHVKFSFKVFFSNSKLLL